MVAFAPGKTEHKRHVRNYAEGDLAEGGFVFTGPGGRLNLVAQNLNNFVRMGSGVDDETWNHHLRAHDYSRWFRERLKDDELADEAEVAESQDHSPEESRKRIFAAIRARYTAPA